MKKIFSSFKDPAGFVYTQNSVLYRKINKTYLDVYEKCKNSGLYEVLFKKNLLIPHTEIAKDTIQPQQIFISYPYEWCFSQLKDAALATLEIEQIALDYGMTLKDATPFNIQFLNGNPLLIDTLSFEPFENKPWDAYKQFCQTFLAPLAMMSYIDIRIAPPLLKEYLNGIPLDLAKRLLPLRAFFKLGLFIHIFLHNYNEAKYNKQFYKIKEADLVFSKFQMLALIDNLKSTIQALKPHKQKTQWQDYYQFSSYTAEDLKIKNDLLLSFIQTIHPDNIWDFGGNISLFSKNIAQLNINTISLDIDSIAVEKAYQALKNSHLPVLPLIMDLTNPSPALGFAHQERDSLNNRKRDNSCILCLAFIHHLAISYNIPFELIAQYFSAFAKHLIIEFVPKTDIQTQKLLLNRKDVFGNYNLNTFIQAFSQFYTIKQQQEIAHTNRILFVMESQNVSVK